MPTVHLVRMPRRHQPQAGALEKIPAARRCSGGGGGGMQSSIAGAITRHCHIVLLYAAAAAVLLCLLMPGQSSSRVSIQDSASVRFVRDRGLKSDTAVADVPKGPQAWLYSLVGTDFPGAPATAESRRAHAPLVVCQAFVCEWYECGALRHCGCCCALLQAPQRCCSTGCGITRASGSGGSRLYWWFTRKATARATEQPFLPAHGFLLSSAGHFLRYLTSLTATAECCPHLR